MPSVLARPQGLQNGDVVTEFRESTLDSFVTYTYPEQQTRIEIENKGFADMIVNVGTYTNQTITPGSKLKLSVLFTSFEIRSTITSQEFYVKAHIEGKNGGDTVARGKIQVIETDVTDVKSKLAEITTASVLVESYKIQTPEVDDTARLQRAIDYAINNNVKKVLLTGKTYTTSNKIVLYEHVIIEGQGQEKTIIDCSYSGFAFEYITPNGGTERQAPHFKGVKIIANNGIKLNDPANGFNDDGTSQEYLMRPLIEDCVIESKLLGAGIGVQWSKCFDGHIWRSKVFNFSVNIDLHGSDLCSIKHNRIKGSSSALIKLTSYTTFGSQALIQHNDLLSPTSGSFIVSSDRSIRIKDNYFEGGGTLTSVITILPNSIDAIIKENRVEVASTVAPNWLDIQPNLYNLVIENNTTSGTEMGIVKFPVAGYNYFTGSKRATVRHGGNTQRQGFPFNSEEQVIFDGKTCFVGSPNHGGLKTANYGLSIKVKEGAFILPPVASYGSMIEFGTGVYGNVNIGIIAKADVSGQVLSRQILNGSTVLDTTTNTLDTTFKYYSVYSNLVASDLNVKLWNDDTVRNGNIQIQKVIVEYV